MNGTFCCIAYPISNKFMGSAKPAPTISYLLVFGYRVHPV
jgi:hypothetical protein